MDDEMESMDYSGTPRDCDGVRRVNRSWDDYYARNPDIDHDHSMDA
jgi:hypothetical protein